LAGMWERTLHVDRVSVNDNFFELGGHSLQSTQLVSAVRATFHIDLSLQEWFQAANLAALAERIEQARQAEVIMQAPLLQHVETHEPLPLSFGQQRLWFLEQLDTGGSAYIIRSAVRLSGRLDFQALRQSFYALVQRHSILRTTFTTYHDQPVQIIHPD